MFVCLTESYLRNDIADCEINIDGFTVYRYDGSESKEKGSIIYTKNCLKVTKIL